MNCQELRARLDAYMDGELGVDETAAADAHLAFCMSCQWAYAKERELMALLRNRLKREGAPPELHATVRAMIGRSGRSRRHRWVRPLSWAAIPAAALVLLVLAVGVPWRGERTTTLPPSLVSQLVEKHLMYSRVDSPAEIATPSPDVVGAWFKGRVRFAVPVPDFSPSGIRLVGGRLSDLSDRQVAYILYEKGRNLVSLFAFPKRGLTLPAGVWTPVGDRPFSATEHKGNEVILWTQGEMMFALVSSLDREALIDCAETVWRLVAFPRTPGA